MKVNFVSRVIKLFKKGEVLDSLALRLKNNLDSLKIAGKELSSTGYGKMVIGGVLGITGLVAGWLVYNRESNAASNVPFTENSCDRSFEAIMHEHFQVMEQKLGHDGAVALVGFIRLIAYAPPGTVKIACDEFLTNYVVGLDLAVAKAWPDICSHEDETPTHTAYRAGIESAGLLMAGDRSGGSHPSVNPSKPNIEDLMEDKDKDPKEKPPAVSDASLKNFLALTLKLADQLKVKVLKSDIEKAYQSAASDQRPFGYKNAEGQIAEEYVKAGFTGLFSIKGKELLESRIGPLQPDAPPSNHIALNQRPFIRVKGFVSAKVYTLIKSTLPQGTKMDKIFPYIAAFYVDNILPAKRTAFSAENFADANIKGSDLLEPGTLLLRKQQKFDQRRYIAVRDSLSMDELKSAIAGYKQYILDSKDKKNFGIFTAEESWDTDLPAEVVINGEFQGRLA